MDRVPEAPGGPRDLHLGDGVVFVAAPLLAATLTGDLARAAGLTLAHILPRIPLALPIVNNETIA